VVAHRKDDKFIPLQSRAEALAITDSADLGSTPRDPQAAALK
jgi:hypothetical protein